MNKNSKSETGVEDNVKADTTKFKVAERWTTPIAKRGFTPIANMFLDRYADLDISTSEALVLVHILRHKWDKQNPFPSAERLARKMGVTATAVRNHTRSLEKKGYLTRVVRLGKASAYDLAGLFNALESAYDIKV